MLLQLNSLIADNLYDEMFENDESWYVYRNGSAEQIGNLWPYGDWDV